MDDLIAALEDAHGIKAMGPGRPVVPAILETEEFRRIRDLPRREWEQLPTLEEMIDAFTEYFKLPDGQMRLKPVQAVALNEAFKLKGGFFPIRVGGGKTLISVLLAVALGAKRPLLLVPGKLVEKT